MVDRALFDFAEAALGKNRDMQWSLSTSILKRQIEPVFSRCATGELSAEQALDIAVDYVAASIANTTEVFGELFARLEIRMDEQIHRPDLPGLLAMQEFFMGLNADTEWATNLNIMRRELYPLFVRVAVGKTTTVDGVTIFCDSVTAKRDYYLELVHGLIKNLALDIKSAATGTQQVEEAEEVVVEQDPRRAGNDDN